MPLDLDRRHKVYGTTIRDWIASTANELSRDAVGLHQLIPVGRDEFGLADDELKEYLRLSVAVLMERGARPAFGCSSSKKFIIQDSVSTAEEVADRLFVEWSSGKEPTAYATTWFILPSLLEEM